MYDYKKCILTKAMSDSLRLYPQLHLSLLH